ncbi:MAG: hypothetical protein FWG69_05590 [Oscillospiraceae bacterium]|nr:hypothetical protein [Oscillospiraceae bacterium]
MKKTISIFMVAIIIIGIFPVINTTALSTLSALSGNASDAAIMVSAGWNRTLGLRSDGTVASTSPYDGTLSWKNITAVASGEFNMIGLKKDGTVVTKGIYKLNKKKNILVNRKLSWTDIIAVAASASHTVGLKKNGRVMAINNYNSANYGQCDVSSWRDIVAVSAGHYNTVGLKKDGTVVETYGNDTSLWKDITAVDAGHMFTVGLKRNGTVVVTEAHKSKDIEKHGQEGVSSWTDIIAISAGREHTVGLKRNGTVVAVGNNSFGQLGVNQWKDIIAVSAGYYYTIGLKKDGTVVAAGFDYNKGKKIKQSGCKADDWNLFEKSKKILSTPKKLKLTAKKATWKNVSNNSGYTLKIYSFDKHGYQNKKALATKQIKKGKTGYKFTKDIRGKFVKGEKYMFILVAKGKNNYINSRQAVSKKFRVKK